MATELLRRENMRRVREHREYLESVLDMAETILDKLGELPTAECRRLHGPLLADLHATLEPLADGGYGEDGQGGNRAMGLLGTVVGIQEGRW